MNGAFDLENIYRFVLSKQHLTENSKTNRRRLVDVVKDVCGLHAQTASTPYLSLWNRIDGFQIDDLSKELYERRSLVKIWGMRRTVHIVPTEHVDEYYQATKRAGGRRSFQLTPIHKKTVKTLDEKGPLTARELAGYIGELEARVQTPYGDMSIGQLRLRELTQSTIVVPVKPKGDWKSNLHTYASFKTWLPAVDLQAVSVQEAKKSVISGYLSGYGPAAIEDIAWWLGITKKEVKETLEGMGDDVARIAIRGLEGNFILLASDVEQLEKCPSEKDVAHLLPKFDPYIMGYKNRQRLISPKYEKKVYWSTRAEVSPTIVINGRIIGTWSYSEANSKISIELSLFEKANKHVMFAIEHQAEKLALFIGGQNAA